MNLSDSMQKKGAIPGRLRALHVLLWVAGLLLLLVACLLRYEGCFTFPFSGDEPFSLARSRDFYEFWRTGDVATISNLQFSLVFALNSLLLNHFDDPVTAIRVVPLAAGVLFFPIFMWLLAKRFGMTVMFVSLTILAFNPTHIGFSQYGRYYSVVFLLANLALYTFFVSFERRSWRLFLVSQLFSLLAFLSHPGAGLLVGAEAAYLVALGVFAWMDGRSLIPKRDAFTMTVVGVFASACLALLVAAIVILSSWSGVSKYQANYDVLSFGAGTILRVGLPLMAFSGTAALYYLFRRDRTGVFFSLAFLCPILAGATLSLLGMEVNPIYVAFVIFPGCVLVAYFLAEIFTMTAQHGGKGYRGYAIAMVFAIGAVLTLGNISEFVSHYIDGGRRDYRAAMNWVEKTRAGKGTIVITVSTSLPIYFCQRAGIPCESFPHEASLNDVVDSVNRGNLAVISYAWWAGLPREDFSRLASIPHWLILRAERDGLTPRASDRISLYADNELARAIIADNKPSDVLKEEYRLETRIGKTRLDHRQNYLLIYGPSQTPMP